MPRKKITKNKKTAKEPENTVSYTTIYNPNADNGYTTIISGKGKTTEVRNATEEEILKFKGGIVHKPLIEPEPIHEEEK